MKMTNTNKRFTIKAFDQTGDRPLELSRPGNMKSHPWSYMELPFDPEYELYNNRMTPASLNNITPDEQYWAVRTDVILRNTGEFPVEISGEDAFKFANYIFTRDINKIKPGRCSYQFACYHDGGMITDGVMLHFFNKLWMAQADGDLFNWYLAHAKDFDVKISDPNVWVSQIQGPKSLDLLEAVIDGDLQKPFNYFDFCTVLIDGEEVIISRTGFSNELGWEIYLQPENDFKKIGDRIWEAGKKFNLKLTGSPVFRARRIEAGLLSAGRDFNNFTTPFDVGLNRFVNMQKGNFVGKQALQRALQRKTINHRVMGLRVKDGIASLGSKIMHNKQCIGEVTSSSWSPYQECGVAIVRLNNNFTDTDSQVEVYNYKNDKLNAHICDLPMYDKNAEIVRGIDRKVPKTSNPWFK
ncbi:MAG: aminomethyltransferase [Rhodobacteraceae bacterium]|nr:MAG: aminomethyltransferase [Paracoccaceae bacterium]